MCFRLFIAVGITGLKSSTLRGNWGSKYQFTNDAGIPATTGFYWDFQYVICRANFVSRKFCVSLSC